MHQMSYHGIRGCYKVPQFHDIVLRFYVVRKMLEMFCYLFVNILTSCHQHSAADQADQRQSDGYWIITVGHHLQLFCKFNISNL